MWDYSNKVKEYFMNPKNAGEIENASAIGEAGSLTCGDALKLYLKINDKGIIEDAKFQTFGCGSAVAASSILTEMVKGKTVEEAQKITNLDIVKELGGLPPEKMHCSVMGHEALEDALRKYMGDDFKEAKGDDKIVCSCFNVTLKDIKEAIKNGAKTVEDIKNATYATSACGRCKNNIQEILEEFTAKKQTKQPLNPVQFVLKVNNVIEKIIQSELAKDCGGIELVDIKGKDVYVKLTGSCKNCCNSHITLKNFVEAQLKELVDNEINVIEVQK